MTVIAMKSPAKKIILFSLLLPLFCYLDAAARQPMPADSLPARWEYLPAADGRTISIDDTWWKNFDDQLLDTLVSRGLAANYDLQNAVNNISIALNTYRSARSDYFPQFTASAAWQKERTSSKTGTGPAATRSYWTAQAAISWQVDLFGKITEQAKAKKNLWQASQAEWTATMLSVTSQIITQYITLREAQMQLDLTQRHARSQLEVVDMVIARNEAGVASMLDVAQAKTVYYSTIAQIPVYENTVAASINAIAVLLGTYPDKLPPAIYDTNDTLPQYRHIIPAGIPVDLLRRRPDIIETEKTVAAYAAQLGVAKKDFLPTLTLDGTISTMATDITDLFSKGTLAYTIAPTLSWSFATGGEQIYNRRIAAETLQSGINSYNLAVLTAVEETNNALTDYFNALKHVRMVDDVVMWARKSLSLSVDLYKNGLTPFSNVVDAQETLLQYETQAVTVRADALTALVQIYTALGGGWDASNIQ